MKTERYLGELWVTVKGYFRLYVVSNFGRVKNIRTGQILKTLKHKQGYLFVRLSKNGVERTKYIHRLVAEAFIPNPKHLSYINHKDEDKTNNRLSNLEWCTAYYNNTYGSKIKRFIKSKSKPVIQLTLSGVYLNEYPSIKIASEITKVKGICSCVRGIQKTAGGYKWEYKITHQKILMGLRGLIKS